MLTTKNKTTIMGILNTTPDSFSDGGKYIDVKKAIQQAKQMVADGADIIDIGGESSRPGADPVSAQVELSRVEPIIKALVKEINIPISIDTYKPEVADTCLKLGASIINDITGVDDEMRKVAAKHEAGIIIMHMQGKPKEMQKNIVYRDVIGDIKNFLFSRAEKARQAGIENIIIDPGIGFGKTLENNLEILNRLKEFKSLNCPILIGASRKSFIGTITGESEENRLFGTIASNIMSILNGANIIRVHDVKEHVQAIKVINAIDRS